MAIAAAAGIAALAVGLSPAGAKVGDLVSDVIGEEDARPALRSLPAAGELLVESESGPWIVREDGSKRLLGEYEQATWSPRGLFIAVTRGRELIAVEPDGDVRWTITAPARVNDPRWSPSGFRIAYRSGDDLRVVAGDGTGDELVARDVAPVAPGWRPVGDSKLAAAPGGHVLTYIESDRTIRTIDVDSGERLETTPRDLELLSTPPSGGSGNRAVSPDGRSLATVRYRRVGRRNELILQHDGRGRERVLFSARGTLTGPAWSPDGRWLLVGLPEADQWLFIRTDGPGRIVAFDRISEQFAPGDRGDAGFPRVVGWVMPQR
jgi:dipeptidyl aminopeptidase/acylaminoacyl peptidase